MKIIPLFIILLILSSCQKKNTTATNDLEYFIVFTGDSPNKVEYKKGEWINSFITEVKPLWESLNEGNSQSFYYVIADVTPPTSPMDDNFIPSESATIEVNASTDFKSVSWRFSKGQSGDRIEVFDSENGWETAYHSIDANWAEIEEQLQYILESHQEIYTSFKAQSADKSIEIDLSSDFGYFQQQN